MDPRDLSTIEKYRPSSGRHPQHAQLLLLKEVGRQTSRIAWRGFSATIYDLIMSAEYILNEGNSNVILASAAFARSIPPPVTRSI
jgi:3-deoxy-7-phosphoheptulonate synthase